MLIALDQAKIAFGSEEVPVGAVIIDSQTGKIISKAHNRVQQLQDPTAHAEIVVLRRAAQIRENYRLPRTAIYVTLESCTMCIGAMQHARVDSLIFGAKETKAGALVSHLRLADEPFYNHHVSVLGGILEKQCATLLTEFFREKRK